VPRKAKSPVDDFDRLPNTAAIPPHAAATVLGRSRATVWRWLKAGVLVGSKVGGTTTLVNVASIRAVLSGGAK
jgi:hypothetical protein